MIRNNTCDFVVGIYIDCSVYTMFTLPISVLGSLVTCDRQHLNDSEYEAFTVHTLGAYSDI